MIDLLTHYGKNIFNRGDSQKQAAIFEQYGNIALDLLFKAILSLALIKLLNITLEYAFIKIFAILFLFDFICAILKRIVDGINCKYFLDPAMTSEMEHYLKVFGNEIDWRSVSNYKDYFCACAFSPAISVDKRILAAINYGQLSELFRHIPRLIDRCYILWSNIIDADWDNIIQRDQQRR